MSSNNDNGSGKDDSGQGGQEMVAVPSAYLAKLKAKVMELSSQVEMLGGYTRLTLPLMNGGRFLYNIGHAEVAIDSLEIHINPARLVMSAAEVMQCLGAPGIDLDNSLMFELNPRPPQYAKQLAKDRAEVKRRMKLTELEERRAEILKLKASSGAEVNETERMLEGVNREIERIIAQASQAAPRKARPNLLILPGGAGSDDSKS